MKNNFLRKVLADLSKKSENWLRTRGTWVILKSGKQICSVSIFSNSVAKLGMASVEAYSPSPIAVLLPPNAMLIHIK
ncbi:hypothetical protein F2Q68_00036912 [Brassica cretica]|uniref:Uncharacterized protein n=1 Tax=Brassica cretica TaxID=69181 RepID=A0A8S9GY79_BRACR|nr:hypothetical protein F2Q68_00036912 [Brassica cretica]